MRILHAYRNPANQAGYLAKALRRLGHEAEVWEYTTGQAPFGFPVDRTILLGNHDPKLYWDTFTEAIERFDVLHFHFGRSLFPDQLGGMPPFWDLPIYRILGKKVFFTFHGSDCRIRSIHEEVNPWSYYKYSDIKSEDDRTRKVIEVIRTYANRMFVVSVDYLHFVPEAHLMPRVIDLEEWPEQPAEQRAVPKILHVPSHPGTKGTPFIVEGLEKLKAEGLEFEFVLREKLPHTEVKAAIRDADVVIDNVITGDYELVSMEAMASSRVAVANLQEGAAREFPDAPIHNVDPNTFVDRMRALITDAALRRSLAERGRAYVAEHHDAPVIANRVLRYYEAPESPVVVRAFPDWLSLHDHRRIERLEHSLFKAEQDLGRARLRENDLRRQLGMGDARSAKDLVPERSKAFLARTKAKIRKRLPFKVRRKLLQMKEKAQKARRDSARRRV